METYLDNCLLPAETHLKKGNLIENLDKKQNATVVEMGTIGRKIQLFSGWVLQNNRKLQRVMVQKRFLLLQEVKNE